MEIGSEVRNFKTGDKVVAMLNVFVSLASASLIHFASCNFSIMLFSNLCNCTKQTGGGLSEFAKAKEYLTVSRPPEVSAAQGAGLPLAGLTAHMALTHSAGIKLDGTAPQKNILVTAASGGVGQYAVQLAKLETTM